MQILAVIVVLGFIICSLVLFAIMQINLAGIKIKDFWSFIEANQILDRLYLLTKKYEKLNAQEQIIFLTEAEKVFEAFEKIPEVLWEEEHQKYKDVLTTYQGIRMLRWASN